MCTKYFDHYYNLNFKIRNQNNTFVRQSLRSQKLIDRDRRDEMSTVCKSSRPSAPAHLRLLEDHGSPRVDATRQQAGRHVRDAAAELARVLRLRDGVQVHDAVEHGRVLVLERHPVLQSTQVVSQMGNPSRLNPRKHAAASRTLGDKKEKNTLVGLLGSEARLLHKDALVGLERVKARS